MEIFKIFVTVMGIVMSLGYYPQAYKIWKNKSAKNISALSFFIFALGTTTWLIYGIVLKDLTITISFIFGAVGAWTAFIMTLIYKNK
jgi:MtN3 and saliva related transmembrane protein